MSRRNREPGPFSWGFGLTCGCAAGLLAVVVLCAGALVALSWGNRAVIDEARRISSENNARWATASTEKDR